jgi:hypothetical protein
MPASKGSAPTSPSYGSKRTLLSRPSDCFYFVFFVFHIINFLCIDGQSFWPIAIVPKALQKVKQDYLQDSRDPFLIAFDSNDIQYQWFAVSVYSSLLIQNPVFVAGVWMLWKGESITLILRVPYPLKRISIADDKRIYPIMASYGLLGELTTHQKLRRTCSHTDLKRLRLRCNVWLQSCMDPKQVN